MLRLPSAGTVDTKASDVTDDSHWMHQALGLAAQALFTSNPNPRVGCCIVDASGALLGQGYTQRAGGAHAEIMALRDAAQQGRDVRGATAYVTLEPCAHHGRTGPCCDALIHAGIARVVAASGDPNPLVAGEGFRRLRHAGIAVETGLLDQESRSLNVGFFSRIERQRPWVRLKIAASLDGHTALPNGKSQWITSPQARTDGHAWRARACAVLTGVGTVLSDDPLLTVREVATPRQPILVVVDSQLKTPPCAKLLTAARPVLIYTVQEPTCEKAQALTAAGAQVISTGAVEGRVDLHGMLLDLAKREINELHVEAGATLNGALLKANLADECLVYMAPTLLGSGTGMAQLGTLDTLSQGCQLQWVSVDRIGPDIRIVARTQKQGDGAASRTL